MRILWALPRVVGVAALLGLLVFILIGGEEPLEPGTPAPAVNARALDGALVDVGLKSGTTTVVNIWGTWCPPCRAELPDLVKAAHKYEGRARFVGLAVDSGNADIESLVDHLGIPYDIAHIDGRTADAWGAQSIPDTYIVDGTGVVRWSVRGAIDPRVFDAKLAELTK